MQAFTGIIATIFGAVVIYLLVKNVGTSGKPVTALGQTTGALTSVVSDLTNSK